MSRIWSLGTVSWVVGIDQLYRVASGPKQKNPLTPPPPLAFFGGPLRVQRPGDAQALPTNVFTREQPLNSGAQSASQRFVAVVRGADRRHCEVPISPMIFPRGPFSSENYQCRRYLSGASDNPPPYLSQNKT